MRINARLDSESEERLRCLEKETGLSVSEIVRRAIECFYLTLRSENADPGRTLMQTGFIGCAEGPSDLSTRYKQALRGLNRKHGHR